MDAHCSWADGLFLSLSRPSRLGSAAAMVSAAVREEVWALVGIAWPTCVSLLLEQLLSFVAILFVGHLGVTALSAAGLALSFTNVFGVSVGYGLSAASDTLGAQAYGANDLKRIGVILQVWAALCVVCVAVRVGPRCVVLCFVLVI